MELVDNAEVLLCDPITATLQEATKNYPKARLFSDYTSFIKAQPEAVIIASPSALHKTQIVQALQAGVAVFAEKPVGINLAEAAEVVAAANESMSIFKVDYSYIYTEWARYLERNSDHLGQLMHIDMTFLNAYSPGSSWAFRKDLAGGGCLLDLGVHFIHLLHYLLKEELTVDKASLYQKQTRYTQAQEGVEDFAAISLSSTSCKSIQLKTAWNAHIGSGAEIRVEVIGELGRIQITNVDKSFESFALSHFRRTEKVAEHREEGDWQKGAVQDWMRKVALYEKANEEELKLTLSTASVLESAYASA